MSVAISMTCVDRDALRAFVSEGFAALGLTAEDAGIFADALIFSELRFHPGQGQGVMRLRRYQERIGNGEVNPRAGWSIVKEGPALALVDAHNDAAVATAKPGHTCEQVDVAALDALRQAGLGDAIRHRIGHGMGMEGHEAPWLAPGDDTPTALNMVFSNESGVYRPGVDGYRTINTMIVTTDGAEVPSHFLRDTPIDARVIDI